MIDRQCIERKYSVIALIRSFVGCKKFVSHSLQIIRNTIFALSGLICDRLQGIRRGTEQAVQLPRHRARAAHTNSVGIPLPSPQPTHLHTLRMSSGLDPSAPSQPTQQTGLNQAQNPADKTATETSTSQQPQSAQNIDHRDQHDVASTHSSKAKQSGLGAGETGELTENHVPESDAQKYSSDGNLEGEQMRAPGEGEIADAVKSGGGGGHNEEKEIGGDMDRKKQEHDAELKRRGQRTQEEVEEEEKEDWTGRKDGVDVGEALGGRGTGVVLAAED